MTPGSASSAYVISTMLAPACRAVFQYLRVASASPAKKTKSTPRERFRIDFWMKHLIAGDSYLPGGVLQVQKHHIAVRKRRLRQRVAQFPAREGRRSDDADTIWFSRSQYDSLASLKILVPPAAAFAERIHCNARPSGKPAHGVRRRRLRPQEYASRASTPETRYPSA
jgi:hypothetical protein